MWLRGSALIPQLFKCSGLAAVMRQLCHGSSAYSLVGPGGAAAVYVWGRGEYGRLGLGDKTGSSRLRPRLVESIQHERVVQAVCGGTHTMALTAEGRIFIWGRGSFGAPP